MYRLANLVFPGKPNWKPESLWLKFALLLSALMNELNLIFLINQVFGLRGFPHCF
jgi:hypothetical protein